MKKEVNEISKYLKSNKITTTTSIKQTKCATSITQIEIDSDNRDDCSGNTNEVLEEQRNNSNEGRDVSIVQDTTSNVRNKIIKSNQQEIFISSNLSSSSFISISNNVISTFIRHKFSTSPMTPSTIPDFLKNGKVSSYLNNNFRCPSRSTPVRNKASSLSTRSTTTIQQPSTNSSLIQHNGMNFFNSGMHRCLIEDFMTLQKGRDVVVLLPEQDERFSCITPFATVQIGKSNYRVYNCVVSISSYANLIVAGMAVSDVKKGFNEGNYGCFVDIKDSSDCSSRICLTWSEVLNAREEGVQVWRSLNSKENCRNFTALFKSRRKTDLGCRSILNYFFSEVYGDRIQLFHLYTTYLRIRNMHLSSQSSNNTQHSNTNDDRNGNIFEEMKLCGESFQQLVTRIDKVYEQAINNTFTEFMPFDEPLLRDDQIVTILSDYMTSLPSHFEMMNQTLMFSYKRSKARNFHLSETNYYNKKLLFMFLSQARIVNSHNLVHFAMVVPGASYSRGLKSHSLTSSVYSGSSTTFETMIKKIKVLNKSMDIAMKEKMKLLNRFVVTVDNNQKGFKRKYQRNGVSNDYIVMTGRTFRYCEEYIPPQHVLEVLQNNRSQVSLSYIDQNIPSMAMMPPFELHLNDKDKLATILYNPRTIQDNNNTIDFTGSRVRAYNHFINVQDVCTNVIFKFFGNYNLSKNEYKHWNHAPESFSTDERMKQAKIISSMKSQQVFLKIRKFQSIVVSIIDPASQSVTKVFTPSVSMRDEITTCGYGMAIIEILEYVGILKEFRSDGENHRSTWALTEDYEKKVVYLCVDGLSLDRHRSFKRKLTKVNQSFSDSFQQSIRFQLALGRVVEVSGPLHVAFHMLQCIFDVYPFLIKWGIQIVAWKRIKYTKVSECFQLSKEFILLLLNECERFLIDVVYHIYLDNDERQRLLQKKDNAAIIVLLSERYLSFLDDDNSDWAANNEYRKMIVSFVITARSFRRYWMGIRNGDRQMQEYILIEWMGVFGVLRKYNYLNICLNSIEREYSEISYTSLEELRRNSYVRRNKNTDLNGVDFHCSALDELQEENNHDVKQLPICGDKASWIQHSKNIGFARACRNFVDEQFHRRHLHYVEDSNTDNTILEPKNKSNHERIHTNVSSSALEKTRIYEFLVQLLCDGNNNPCELDYSNGVNIITKLKTSLKQDETSTTTNEDSASENTTPTDTLHDCFSRIFEVNRSIDGTDIDEANNNVQRMEDSGDNDLNITNATHPRKELALSNVFNCGKRYLEMNNIIELRNRRKKRLERDEKYYMAVNDTVNENMRKMDLTLADFEKLQSNVQGIHESLSFRDEYISMME